MSESENSEPTSDCSCLEDDSLCPNHSPPSRLERYVNPVVRVLLAAVLLPSPRSPFSILSACPDLVETIYKHLKCAWAECLTHGYSDDSISRFGNAVYWNEAPADHLLSKVALCRVTRLTRLGLEFPKPSGLMCNMLPFLADNFNTIPSEYRGYLPIIRVCRSYVNEPGRVWYLTIHESESLSYEPQRRGGIHVEGFLARPVRSTAVSTWHPWGMGLGDAKFTGGIFHVSTVTDSCRMWNVQVPRHPSAALGIGCDLEHLRGVLDDTAVAVYPRANELYWMTDATPHESLPLKKGTYRQYFRLVTSQVSAWWENHSTKNRLGVQPDCRILRHNKFDKDAYVGFDDAGDSGVEVGALEAGAA